MTNNGESRYLKDSGHMAQVDRDGYGFWLCDHCGRVTDNPARFLGGDETAGVVSQWYYCEECVD